VELAILDRTIPRRRTVMQHLSHIVSAIAQDLKPARRDISKLTNMIFHPAPNGRIPPNGIG
jgi:hypothetical protein